MTWLKYSGLTIAAIVVFLCVGFGTYLSYLFGYQYGSTDQQKLAMGLLLAFVDVSKVLIPVVLVIVGAAWTWKIKGPVWMLVIGLSVISGLGSFGFFAGNRADFLAKLTHKTETVKDVKSEKDHKIEQRAWLPKHRPLGVVEGVYQQKRCGLKRRQKWKSCRALLAEMGTAREARRLDAEIARLKTSYKKTEVSSGKDMQLVALSSMTGWKTGQVLILIGLIVAVSVELVGLFLPAMILEGFRSLAYQEAVNRAENEVKKPSPVPDLSYQKPTGDISLRLVKPDSWQSRFHMTALQSRSDGIVSLDALFEQYVWWAKQEKISPLTQASFGEHIREYFTGVADTAIIDLENQPYVKGVSLGARFVGNLQAEGA